MKWDHFKSVIFDFDYTLADASRGAISCANYALNTLGFPSAAGEDIRKLIGLSLKRTFRELAGPRPEAEADEFVRLFHEQADRVMVDSAVMLEGVPAVLETLGKSGLTLGVVSTKFRFRIEAILRRENMLAMFKVIVGGEDVTEFKPDPEGLLQAIQKLNGSPSNTLYVGDSLVDARAAQAAEVPFVAVLTGMTPRDDFIGYPVREIINDLSELQDLIES